MRGAVVCLLLFVAPLLAQARLQAGEIGATVPSVEAGLGYVYFNMAMPSQRVGLAGLEGSGLVNFNSRWGMTADAMYVERQRIWHGTERQCPQLTGWSCVLSRSVCAVRDIRSRIGRSLPGGERGPGEWY